MREIGTIFVIAAASGTGKTSLVKMLTESLDKITTSISHTTREIRPEEQDGVNYFFINEKQFKEMIAADEFLEHAKVFGHYYGTSKKHVEEQLNNGIDVILEIDWQGAKQIAKSFPKSVSIFILPPSIQELRNRLENRKQDSTSSINNRLAAAHEEITHCNDFDYIVINDKFDIALVDLRSIIRAQRLKKAVQLINQQKLLEELMKNQ